MEKKTSRNWKETGLGIFREAGYNLIHTEKEVSRGCSKCCGDINKATFKVTVEKQLCDWGKSLIAWKQAKFSPTCKKEKEEEKGNQTWLGEHLISP